MPVFNLELQFDGNGLQVGIKKLESVSAAASKAEKAVKDVSAASVSASSAVNAFADVCEKAAAAGLKWDASAQKFRNSAGKIASSTELAAAGIGKIPGAARRADSAMSGLFTGLKRLGSITGMVSAGFHALVAAFAVDSIFSVGKALLDASLAMDRLNKSYQTIYGTAYAGQAQLQYVLDTSRELGLQFQTTAEAAKGFFAAGQGTSLAGDLNEIFTAFSAAGTALSLTSDQMQGTFTALGQMISKGKVQAEELRGQLGERLPGAFQLAAEAMNMTTAELDKFMADGKLTAEDLLPRLADALQNKFGKAAEEAARGVQSAINRMTTEWELFKSSILNSDAVVAAINLVTSALEGRNKAMKAVEDNARIDAILAAEGVSPAGRQANALSDTGEYIEVYTEQQREIIRIRERQAQLVTDIANKEAQAEVEAIGKGRAAADAYLKHTREARLEALAKEKKETDAAIDAQIEVYRKQGVSYDDLTRKKLAVEQEYQRKVAELNRKNSGPAAAQSKYTAELERTRLELESLQKQAALDATEDITAKKIRIEEDYQDTLIRTRAELEKEITSGRLSQTQADTLYAEREKVAALEKQLSLRRLEEQHQQKSLEKTRGQLEFYERLGDLSGDYSATVALQNRLIDAQASDYKKVYGIAEDLIAEWERLAKLQVSTDPFDGAYRGLLKFTAQYGNDAARWESITYDFASDFESTTRGMFDEFLDTGKVSFDSLGDLFKQLLKDMAYQALVQPIVMSVVGGVAGAVGGGSTAGGSTAGGGSSGLVGSATGLAQNWATGKLMQGLTGTGGIFSGLANGINAGAASMFPGLFAPSASAAATNASVNALVGDITGTAGTLSQTTLLGTLGAAGMGFGLGSLGGSLLSGILGTNQQSTSLGGGIGAGLGAAVGSIFPGIGTAVGGIVGGLLGSGIGGLFGGGGGPDPGMSIHSRIDLLRDYVSTIDTHRGRPMYNANAPGYNISSISWDGVPHEAAVQGADATAQVIDQALAAFDTIGQAVASLGNGALEASYQASLATNRYMTLHTHWEEDPINLEAHLEDVQEAFMERMYTVLAGTDVSGLAIAADGMIANTFDEVSQSIADAISFVNLGANLGEYQDDFEQAIGGKVLDMLNSMDTSSLNLNIDKSSLAGWQRAAQAIAAWNEVETALDGILNPADELFTALKTANLQMDNWIANLRQLGWQEQAIAEIESQRAAYLGEYRDAIVQSLEQDVHLRQMALTSGRDSDAYAIQSLLYQQANELDEMISKTGEYSRYTANLVNVQKAELAQLRLDRFLQKQVNAAEETARLFENAADVISNALTDLWTGDKNLLGTRYDEALSTLEQTYMQAMAGDTDALQSLPQIGQTVLALAKEQLATRGEYDRAFYDVHVMLSNAQAYSENQLSTQEALLETLHAELGVEQQVQLTTEQISLQLNALRSELGAALNEVAAGQSMDEGRLGTPTGVYGSYYATESELLVAKAHSLNATAWRGRTDWTPSSSKQQMLDDFGSVAEWYRQFGVYEGFASGGLTPVNTPFIVGENGPELMMAPQTYGVLSNRDSIDLIARDRAASMFDLSLLVDEIRELKNLTRQLVVKTDKTAYNTEKSLGYMRMWDAEGMPAAASV